MEKKWNFLLSPKLFSENVMNFRILTKPFYSFELDGNEKRQRNLFVFVFFFLSFRERSNFNREEKEKVIQKYSVTELCKFAGEKYFLYLFISQCKYTLHTHTHVYYLECIRLEFPVFFFAICALYFLFEKLVSIKTKFQCNIKWTFFYKYRKKPTRSQVNYI